MTYRGTVRGGVIIPEEGVPLHDGETVQITVEEPQTSSNWGKVFGEFAGAITNLPADLARNHDHYIHGTPKR